MQTMSKNRIVRDMSSWDFELSAEFDSRLSKRIYSVMLSNKGIHLRAKWQGYKEDVDYYPDTKETEA